MFYCSSTSVKCLSSILFITEGNDNIWSQLGLKWGYTYNNCFIILFKSEEKWAGILG